MAKKLTYIIAIIVYANINYLYSQNSYLPLSNSSNFYYEDIIYNEIDNFHTSVKPYLAREISLKSRTDSLLITKNNSYLFNSHLISENFNFNINPIINSISSIGSLDYSLFSVGAALNTDIDVEVVAGGSTAKGTFLAGDFDIDLFVRFKTITKDFSDSLELLLSDLATDQDIMIERIHGSRDYFTFAFEGLFFEIVLMIIRFV